MGDAIAVALSFTAGGYGVYITDKRLFVIQNPEHDLMMVQGVQFGAFMMDELFGTTVDVRPKTIQELERDKIFETDKNEITTLTLKKPVLLSGYLTINSGKAPVFRAYIDHKKAYQHIEQLMRTISPKLLHLE